MKLYEKAKNYAIAIAESYRTYAKSTIKRRYLEIGVAGLAALLSGCPDRGPETPEQIESETQRVVDRLERSAEEAQELASEAEEEIESLKKENQELEKKLEEQSEKLEREEEKRREEDKKILERYGVDD